jgi:hypothetical protein
MASRMMSAWPACRAVSWIRCIATHRRFWSTKSRRAHRVSRSTLAVICRETASAARILGDIGDVARFATRARFASLNGTAPLDASSGEQQRHRLSRAGNRRINRALHIIAIVQIRHDTEGRAYFRRRVAAGKTKMEALRALKRRLSDVVYRQLVADAGKASPGGHTEATVASSAADPTPTVDSSDQSQPGLNAEPTHPDPDDHDTPTPLPTVAPAQRRRTADTKTTHTAGRPNTAVRRSKRDLKSRGARVGYPETCDSRQTSALGHSGTSSSSADSCPCAAASEMARSCGLRPGLHS